MNELTQLLKTLSGSTRLRILQQLLEEPDYTVNLSKKLNLESSIVTHSLKKLEKQGLVHSYRKGKLKYYKIKNKEILRSIFVNLNKLNNKR